MHIVTAKQMRAMDEYTIDHIGMPEMVLMENAGREASMEAIKMNLHSWLILVGKGNNGGDGLVMARYLKEAGHQVMIVYAIKPSLMEGTAANQRDMIERLNIPSMVYVKNTLNWHSYDGVIDALLGTGSQGPPREPYASLIEETNQSGLPVISVDIPSGLDADSGFVHTPCINASVTVALAFMKRGHVLHPGVDVCGKIVVKSIGIPLDLADIYGGRTYFMTSELLKSRWNIEKSIDRLSNTHKGSYGHTGVIGGSLKYSGAGQLASKAALRTGCGLVSWAIPRDLMKVMLGHTPEIMLQGISDQGSGHWSISSIEELLAFSKNKDALAIGCGLGRFEEDTAWLRALWENSICPLVLDADALNIIADANDFGTWKKRPAAVILTPHPGEMARLLKRSVHQVQSDRLELARQYAQQHGVTLVLKGSRTVCATPQGDVFVNTSGNAGMATAGAGDVLAGVIASLLAQGHDAEAAAGLGLYWHGAAGDRAAAKRNTPASLIAGDIIEEL